VSAHHPSTAALLCPAHVTRRGNGCFVAGGAIPEMTPTEWRAFATAVEQMANGFTPNSTPTPAGVAAPAGAGTNVSTTRHASELVRTGTEAARTSVGGLQ
jgi:hypothetical protein